MEVCLLFYLFKAAILSNSKNFVVGRFVRHVEISPQSPQSSKGIDRWPSNTQSLLVQVCPPRAHNMEVVLDSGVNFIIYLQNSWAGWQSEMLFFSKVGDPRNSFLIYFPVVYHLNRNLGISVLWTAIISEWLNLVLKW